MKSDFQADRPRIFVLIPVFNRLAHTKRIVECLRRQQGVAVQIVIVDDGSTDGTADFLAAQPDVMTLKGNGNLWWAGAADLAMRKIHPLIQPGDFFAFMNNDTSIDDGFLHELAKASNAAGRAVVGSIVRSAEPPHELLDIGPRADLWSMAIWDIARDVSDEEHRNPAPIYNVDFLPGRGTLYPAEVLDRVGYMRPLFLPHYHADYEFADRVRRAGFSLIVSSAAVTYSTDAFGNQRRAATFWQRKFGKGSSENSLHKIAFFCLVGSPVQRLTAPARMAAAEVERKLHPVKIFAIKAVRKSMRVLKARIPVKLLWVPLGWMLRIPGCRTLVERGGMLAASTWSSRARARLLFAIERRSRGRMEALQAYAATSLVLGESHRAAIMGDAGSSHAEFLRKLRLEAADASAAIAPAAIDVALCAWRGDPAATLPPAHRLAQLPRAGGVLYCLAYGPREQHPRGLEGLFEQLRASPELEILADGIVGHADPACTSSAIPLAFLEGGRLPAPACEGEPPRFFVARRASNT